MNERMNAWKSALNGRVRTVGTIRTEKARPRPGPKCIAALGRWGGTEQER